MLCFTVIVHLNCGNSVISFFCLQQCIDCVLNLPINEKKCLLQAKQGVYAIIRHDNLRQKASLCLVFCVGVKTKCPTRNPVCIRETPVRGVRSSPPPPPPTKSARYGPVLQIRFTANTLTIMQDQTLINVTKRNLGR